MGVVLGVHAKRQGEDVLTFVVRKQNDIKPDSSIRVVVITLYR